MKNNIKSHFTNIDLNSIVKKASITYIEKEDELLVRNVFDLYNRSNQSLIFILLVGLTLFGFVIFNTRDCLVIILTLVVCVPIVVLTILTIFKQMTDYVLITKNYIEFKNSLKKVKFTLNSDMKVRMDAKTVFEKSLRPHSSNGFYFRIIELYLIHDNAEYRFVDFQVNDKDKRAANILGSKIVKKIKNFIVNSDNSEY